MVNKILIVFVVLLTVAVGNAVHAQGTSGLVDGLWFSRDPVTNFGETIVYSVIRNQTSEQLQGIATLVVDSEAVGAQEIRVDAGDIQKVSIPHEFSPGTHNVSMSFTAGNGIDVTLTELQTKSVFVVIDTDGDGVQNTTDPDDDNDGIPDAEDAEPLEKNILPRPKINLSETGQSFLKTITKSLVSGEERNIERDRSTEETTNVADTQSSTAIDTVIRNIEAARKRGATAMRKREEVRREALEEITRVEEGFPAVEGFKPSVSNESKKREHQIAAAGASIMGTMFEKGWLFYSELFVLTLGILHLMWVWFKKRFANIEAEEDEV